jgi:hypothetical protein
VELVLGKMFMCSKAMASFHRTVSCNAQGGLGAILFYGTDLSRNFPVTLCFAVSRSLGPHGLFLFSCLGLNILSCLSLVM